MLTQTGTVSGIQTLQNGRLLFTRSSLTSPNDVFVIRNLNNINLFSDDVKQVSIDQLTKFTEDELESKSLSTGEDFYFEGAENKTVHGWIRKPPGFKEGEKAKWPVVLLIHGGKKYNPFFF